MTTLVLTIILLLLLLTIAAGPLLEDIIDRIWPPDGRRAHHGTRPRTR